MSRLARQLSQTGLYHIVFHGVNRQHIFEEESDYAKLKETLVFLKIEMSFDIYAYCFMSNHVHLLINEHETGDISTIMKRLLTKYARWFNIKYQRSGALIANRYKSKPVEVDEYFLPLIRYIHRNPIKAGLIKQCMEYKWSSYREFIGDEVIADTKFVFEIMEKHVFVEFHNNEEVDKFNETRENNNKTNISRPFSNILEKE